MRRFYADLTNKITSNMETKLIVAITMLIATVVVSLWSAIRVAILKNRILEMLREEEKEIIKKNEEIIRKQNDLYAREMKLIIRERAMDSKENK